MSLYGFLRRIYKRHVPASLKRLTWSHDYPFWRLVEPIKGWMQRRAHHDEIYDESYFHGQVEFPMFESASVMGASLVREFGPKSVIDIGCGTGVLLEVFQRHGLSCLGLDNAEAGLALARKRGVPVMKVDLEQPLDLNRRADLVVSTEVAEHLPESSADRYVDLLCQLADTVVITAATPGQGGTDHVNEQPNDYWIEKFVVRDYGYDEACTLRLRDEWRERGTASFYHMNVLVFCRVS